MAAFGSATIFRLDGGKVIPREEYGGYGNYGSYGRSVDRVETIIRGSSGDGVKPKSRNYLRILIKILFVVGMVVVVTALAYLITSILK